jgi:two-component system response regulator MprA
MNGTVLVVDDDLDIRSTIGQILREEGFTVRTARDGLEALLSIADVEPDLVLLDLMMPVLDGWQVLETLRSARSQIPVVILSAFPAEGCAGYIKKPVSYERLFQLLKLVRARVAARARDAGGEGPDESN